MIEKRVILKNRKKSYLWIWLVLAALLIVAVGLGALIGSYTNSINIGYGSFKQVFVPPFGGKKSIKVLVLGEDNTTARMHDQYARGLSDTIILASFDLESKTASAISIPRDTLVDIPGYGQKKINSSHMLGGPMLTMEAVEQLTGIKPQYYIKTNVQRFKELVDAVGGVDIDVEKDMRYKDTWGGLYIDLKKGFQHLDGEKAMQYVRFRHDVMGDITRIQRQQKFLKALAAEAAKPENYSRIPAIMDAVNKNVYTNMTIKDLIYLARMSREVDLESVQTETYPGVPETIEGISYWVPDRSKGFDMVNRLFFSPQPKPGFPKVEVRNGNGREGVAQVVADILTQNGYRVSSVENADSFDHPKSEVIVHKENLKGVEEIASLLNSADIKQDINEETSADVTVIIGKDYLIQNVE